MKMTYLQKLRRKGLQSRLVKKKRKELKKQIKSRSNKPSSGTNGISKTKLILNSEGNVVSNKFDFADTDLKKDSKKKLANANNEINSKQPVNLPNGHLNQNVNSKENFKNNLKPDSNKTNSFKKSPIKRENSTLENAAEESSNNVKPASKQGPMFNKENKMVFSKVYVPENKKNPMNRESKKNNPKKMLEKLKKDKTKISELEKEDKEKAVTLKEKQKWATALKRASGEKVKDDPELLRKSIAREKNKKMRSQKKWKARLDHIEKEKDDKQKKRKDNIQARKTEKKKKKMKKAIKKGSFVPL